jgi:hypothetical protein
MSAMFGKKDKKKKLNPDNLQVVSVGTDAEIAAAIAVALRLYSYKAREYEDTIITIQRVMRPYSPWSSKIYNMKQMPHRISTRPRK